MKALEYFFVKDKTLTLNTVKTLSILKTATLYEKKW